MSPGTNQVRTVRPDKASRIMTPAVKPPPTATNRPSGDHETAALGVQTSPYSGSTFEISETVIGGAVAIPKGSTDAISRANPRTTARRTSKTTIAIRGRIGYRVPPPRVSSVCHEGGTIRDFWNTSLRRDVGTAGRLSPDDPARYALGRPPAVAVIFIAEPIPRFPAELDPLPVDIDLGLD